MMETETVSKMSNFYTQEDIIAKLCLKNRNKFSPFYFLSFYMLLILGYVSFDKYINWYATKQVLYFWSPEYPTVTGFYKCIYHFAAHY